MCHVICHENYLSELLRSPRILSFSVPPAHYEIAQIQSWQADWGIMETALAASLITRLIFKRLEQNQQHLYDFTSLSDRDDSQIIHMAPRLFCLLVSINTRKMQLA